MNKKGFISISVIYSFLLLFVLLMLGIVYSYMTRDNLINTLVTETKDKINGTSEDTPIVDQNVQTFTYLADEAQTWSAPKTGKYKIELWGTGTTWPGDSPAIGHNGGGYTSGIISLEQNEILYLYIGKEHSTFNGGAEGGIYQGGPAITQTQNSYGNGATDIRCFADSNNKCVSNTSNLTWSDNLGLNSRIMVAGAGASGNSGNVGQISGASTGIGDSGYAGGLRGYPGLTWQDRLGYYAAYIPYAGEAGTQVSGGSGGKNSYNSLYGGAGKFGKGGAGGSGANSWGGSTYGWSTGYGGSGGYYGSGGSAGSNSGWWSPGGTGGGSSYISGHTGCVAIVSSSDTQDTRTKRTGTGGAVCTEGINDNVCSIHYSEKKFSETKMIDGKGLSWTNAVGSAEAMPNPLGGTYPLNTGHTGNGYIRITYVGEADPIYNYGDGSLNTVSAGYNNVVKVNGQKMYVPSNYLGTGNYSGFQAQTSPGNSITDPFISYFGSQFDGGYANPIGNWIWHATNDTGMGLQYIKSGTNNYTFTSPITGEKTVYFHTMAAYLTGSLNLNSLKFLTNGTYYTLEEMVNNKLIYPLVLIGSQYLNYIYQTPLNLYSGGDTGNGNYSYWRTLFMTKPGTIITGFTLYASKTTNSHDGFGAGSTDIANFRMTL